MWFLLNGLYQKAYIRPYHYDRNNEKQTIAGFLKAIS